MFSVLLEFILSFIFLSLQINSLSSSNNLIVNIINQQIESNFKNTYQSFLYNVYEDSFDNDYFEKFLDIDDSDCELDNDDNGNKDDPIDGCLVYFVPVEGKIYKYEGKLSDKDNIIKDSYKNELINGTFISVKKEDDYYDVNVFKSHIHEKIHLGNFKIYKDK